MDRTINSPASAAVLTVCQELLDAVVAANAAEPYVAADYDAPALALYSLLTVTFGDAGAYAVREATYDGCSIREAVAAAKAAARSSAADAYDLATARQAEADALAAFDAVAAGQGDVAAHLRTFAAATDHLATVGAGIVLDGQWLDRDTTDARMVAAARLSLVSA